MKYAAITGASNGIGRAIAMKFASEGVSLALLSRRSEKLAEVAREARSLSPQPIQVIPFRGDVRDRNSIKRFFDKIQRLWKFLDIFVNNAGIVHMGGLTDLSDSQVEELIDTNFGGSVWAIYYAMQRFKKQGSGTLVNISSTAALKSYPRASLYAAAKCGIQSLVGSLEEQYIEQKDIKVVSIIPGATLTGFFSDRRRSIRSDNMIHPEDIAALVWMSVTGSPNFKISQIVIRQSGKVFKEKGEHQ
ncbi:MAG: SDR family oxidoreductase [Chlamydiae bacterium]|nr:SDR family oxidoreductase [Chlamydiota bacterium]